MLDKSTTIVNFSSKQNTFLQVNCLYVKAITLISSVKIVSLLEDFYIWFLLPKESPGMVGNLFLQLFAKLLSFMRSVECNCLILQPLDRTLL